MTTTKRLLLFGLGSAVLIAGVVIVLVLRQRSADMIPSDALPLGTTTSTASFQPNAGFTPQEIQRRDEVKRLQQTLPSDIRATWTPEFQKKMETPNK